jgi:hypothetical protein
MNQYISRSVSGDSDSDGRVIAAEEGVIIRYISLHRRNTKARSAALTGYARVVRM